MAREEVVFRVELTEGGSGSASPGRSPSSGGDDFADTRARNRQREAQRKQERREQMAELEKAARQGKLDDASAAALAGLRQQFGEESPAAEAAREGARRKPPPSFGGAPINGDGAFPTGRRGRKRVGNKAPLEFAARSAGAASAARSASRLGLSGAGSAAAASAAAILSPPAAIALVAGLGAAAAAATPLLFAFRTGLKATTDAFKEIEQLGQLNVEIARAQAFRELRQIQGRIRRGRAIGPEAADFIGARSQLDQALLDAGNAMLKEILPLLTQLVDLATAITNEIRPVISAVADVTPEDLMSKLISGLEIGGGFSGIAFAQALRLLVPFLQESLEDLRKKRESEAEDIEKVLNFFDPNEFLQNIPIGTEGI